MAINKIRIGSRDSRLAVIQAEMVIAAIKKYNPDIETELITMKTTGDRILDKSLDKIGGKGLFVKELDQALYNNKVDITVHSYKDMPLEDNPQLPVVALSRREDPRDVLILPQGTRDIDNLAFTALPIGSSSLRRQIQLREIFPECTASPIRGNVQTRLDKLDKGEFSAVVLAAAGIKRLGIEERIAGYFSTDQLMPAASQGIITVQGRAGENFEYLRFFHSEESRIISLAERTFVRELNGGCSSPIAAYAVVRGRDLILKGLYFHQPAGHIVRECITGDVDNARELGLALAGRIKENLINAEVGTI